MFKKVFIGVIALTSVAVADIHKDRIDVYSAVVDSINNQMVDLKMSYGEVRIGNIVRVFKELGTIPTVDCGYDDFVVTDEEYVRVSELMKVRDEYANKIMQEYSMWNEEEVTNDDKKSCPNCGYTE